ncbi:reverse transcriptase domain-containing protein, partial [Tanacetum coccineum]
MLLLHKGIKPLLSLYTSTIYLELIANAEAFNKYNQVMNFLLRVKRAKFVLHEARRWVWKWELIASRINSILTSAGLVLCSDGTVFATYEKEVDCIKKQFDEHFLQPLALGKGNGRQIRLFLYKFTWYKNKHYEDILPVIMDKIRRDKQKEVHVRLDVGESPKKSRRRREDSQNSSAGHRKQSALERLNDTYSPSITKSGPSRTSSRNPSQSRGRSFSRDHHRIRDCLHGIKDSYDDTYSSHRTGTKYRERSRNRDHSRIMKRWRESKSPPSRGSKSSTSNR